MVTSFVVRAGLPHRDDFTAPPLVRALVAEAEARGDRRAAVEEERRLLRPAL